MRWKVVTALLLSVLVLPMTSAFASQGDKSVEATLNYGTEAFDGVGGQFGVTAGFGYELPKNLQGRVDVSYYRSSKNKGDMDVTGTRVPIDFGIRYLKSLGDIDPNLTAYGQGALEVSFDEWKQVADMPSKSATRVGIVVGAGAEYTLDRNYGAILNLQYHIIEDSYFSTGIGMAYHF